MMRKTIKVSLLALAMSSMVMAEDVTEEAIAKALEGIKQIEVAEFAPNRVISEEEIKQIVPVKKVVKVHHKKKVAYKKTHKKPHKKHYKKHTKRKPKVDIMDLPMAKTWELENK